MDYSYILNTSIPQKDKLLAFGFSETSDSLELKKEIAGGQFYTEIKLSDKKLCADVFETATNEKYVLFNVATARGAFVGQIRNEVQNAIEEIRSKCFICQDIKEKYIDFLYSYFHTPGDNPWGEQGDDSAKMKCVSSNGQVKGSSATSLGGKYDMYTVYRCPNNKWFALVMRIKFKNLGFESDEPVWAVNLKAENVESITDKKSIFPAYHMNKKYWITVLLTAVTDFEKLCELTKKSYALVQMTH